MIGVCVLCAHAQNMSMFESELENLLGEFHIRMKGEIRKRLMKGSRQTFGMLRWCFLSLPGLAGFARLCPGDQYEVSHKLQQIPTFSCQHKSALAE